MQSTRLLSHVSGLTDATARRGSAQALALEIGAEELLIFIPDAELGALLPAPGFPQTLPNGRAWQNFLESCAQHSPQRAQLAFPGPETMVQVVGFQGEGGSVLVLLGGSPNLKIAQDVALLLPLLTAAFRGERATMIAEGNLRIASQTATQAKLLASSLDKARHALRKALSEAEMANLAKDRFLAALSHELRTPLTPVLLAAGALEADLSLPEPARRDLRMIRRNVDLEVQLIDDLLDVSRVIAGKLRLQPQLLDLNAAVQDAVEICQAQLNEKGLRLTLQLAPSLAPIEADATRLQQVLWNLLKNAAKFTPPGGKIVVRTEEGAQGGCRVRVQDSGVGIGAEALPRIFNAFEQASEHTAREFGGLGMGLAISKAIVDMHQGVLTATSDGLGQGATFTVELPPARAAALGAGVCPASTPAHGPGLDARILIAEDHADTAQLLCRLLKRAGHSVQWVGSVAAALELLSRERFDLLLSDLGLPDAAGYDLMRQAAKLHGLRGIAMSGYGTSEDIQRSREAGFSEHLVKPINIEQLKAIIQLLMNQDSPLPRPDAER